MKLTRGFVAMVAIAALVLFALSSFTHARAGPEKDKAVTHQAVMVNAGELARQPFMMVTPALYTTSQIEQTASARSRRAYSVHTYDGGSPTLRHRREPPAFVQIE